MSKLGQKSASRKREEIRDKIPKEKCLATGEHNGIADKLVCFDETLQSLSPQAMEHALGTLFGLIGNSELGRRKLVQQLAQFFCNSGGARVTQASEGYYYHITTIELGNKPRDPIIAQPSVIVTNNSETTNMKTSDYYTTAGQIGALGDGASVHKSTFQQHNVHSPVLQVLAEELGKLRQKMHAEDKPRVHDIEIGAVAAAQNAAAAGDEQGVFSNLKQAGMWAFDLARDIGAEIAAAAIEKSLGI